METIFSIKPLLAILVSLGAVPLISASGKSPNMRETWTFLAAIIKCSLVISMIPAILNGQVLVFTLAHVLPGVPIAFRVDALGLLFAVVASFLWIITSIYSMGYMRAEKEHSQTRYFSFFAIALSATMGVAFSANLLTLYLFYEVLSFSTYPLVTHHQDQESRVSGRKYLAYLAGASIALALPAMIIIYNITGTLDFSFQGILAGQEISTGMLFALLLMLVFGFAKAGIMPLHSWLPAAMVAPTPVSALLHAVAVVKVGVFSVFRVITGIFGLDLLSSTHLNLVVMYLAGITLLVASLIALSQDNLKRRLAFSTISQLSYIVLGAALLAPTALLGGAMHIANHAFMKITLFFCAGAIFVRHHKKNVSELDGIGKKMPFTMGAFTIGALGMVGLPPVAGFVSKWYLCLGSLEANHILFLIILLISSLLNAAYFFPIVFRAFFRKPAGEAAETNTQMAEAPYLLVVPLCLAAAYSLVLGLVPDIPFNLLELAQTAVLQITQGG